jgi:hypothetical protein
MASITQTIPNFFGGISEVPDSQKGQGQVNDALNCIPDLNRGLYKRPGARRVGTSPLANATSDGVWFHYYRDETEGSYIGQVATNGHVTMWDADTGAEITVNHDSGTESYLSHSGGEQLQFTTINDSTFVCNRNKVTAMQPLNVSKTDERPHTYSAFVELKRVQNGRQYGINIHSPGASTVSITTATRISVDTDPQDSNGNQVNLEGFNNYTGHEGHCPHIGTKVFKRNSGNNKKNLIFRLTITGQQGPKPDENDDTPEAEDFTCSYSADLELLHGGEGWAQGDTVQCTVSGQQYTINIDKVETVSVRASIKAVRPEPTPFDAQTNVSVDSILGGITDALPSSISSQVIGNGIYLHSTSNFTVEAQNTDLMTVITDQVNDVTGLPFQCKKGYIVKVANSSAAEDDYYLKFEGTANVSGPGSWVECAEPGILNKINDTTMPVIIQRQSGGNFRVKKFSYNDREVGDDNTNPLPSFIGKTINKVVFFRNRIAFLSDENIILSRPGDLGNFFVNTALTVSGTDPIDISSSSKYPGILFDAIEINTGLLVFGEKQQFLLATDSDILNPDSARLSSIATYNYNTAVPPFSLGTTAGFIDNAGAHSRFFVMSNVAREGEPNVNELSKTVSRKLSKEVDLLANSRENTSVFFGKSNSNEVFGYKYFNVADKQIQSSWFRWTFSRPLRYHCVVNDSYIMVDNQNFLQRIDLIRDDESTVQEHDNEYLIHLDNYSSATGSYNTTTRKTSFSLSWLANVDRTKNLVAIQPGTSGVMYQSITVPTSGTTLTLDGNWSGTTTFGYLYNMEVKLPRFFVQKVTGEKTVNEERGSLVIHRVKPLFGRLGEYSAVATRTGKDDFLLDFASSTYDRYLADNVLVEDEYQGVVPIYEKNNNFILSIFSTSPLPATLISLTWEGDYSPKYYKNV